jgi:subtilisin family serine protease
MLNFRARSITQTATVGSDSSYVPYTRMGLQGQGEVVAVGDTGADQQSCYFIEANATNRVTPSPIYSPTTNPNARKIVQYSYYPGGDTTDDVSGHGSFVLGTVIGNKPGSNLYRGKVYRQLCSQTNIASTLRIYVSRWRIQWYRSASQRRGDRSWVYWPHYSATSFGALFSWTICWSSCPYKLLGQHQSSRQLLHRC